MGNVNTENLKQIYSDLDLKVAELERELDTTKKEREVIKRMIDRYGDRITLNIGDITPPKSTEFKAASLREAVRAVMKRHAPRALKADQIKKEIMAGGYKTTSKNLKPPIFIMLGKLTASGEVKRVKAGLYKYRENTNETVM
ncbi:hypothetical protein JYT16_01690 [Gemmatimonas aurantiaca]|nr:hypothetical protein [Gemmatimonas aurantiaca]